jgi:tripartite-type tricarboxylate transporter receptor subunit TctC
VPSLPFVPTLAEQGLKNFEVVVWHGLYVAKGTPKPVLDKLVAALQASVKDLEAEINKWSPIIKKAGIYAD